MDFFFFIRFVSVFIERCEILKIMVVNGYIYLKLGYFGMFTFICIGNYLFFFLERRGFFFKNFIGKNVILEVFVFESIC